MSDAPNQTHLIEIEFADIGERDRLYVMVERLIHEQGGTGTVSATSFFNGWCPMDRSPPDEESIFWLEWADDVTPLTTGPGLGNHLFIGKPGTWGAFYKAVCWMPKPSPPEPGVFT